MTISTSKMCICQFCWYSLMMSSTTSVTEDERIADSFEEKLRPCQNDFLTCLWDLFLVWFEEFFCVFCFPSIPSIWQMHKNTHSNL